MPIQTVECVLCKKIVNKRATFSLGPLGIGSGRACRTHEKVATAAQAMVDSAELERKWREANRALQITCAAGMVRALCTFRGFQPEQLYHRFRVVGASPGDVQAIQNEVTRFGGPLMSLDDTLALLVDPGLIFGK